MKAQLTTLVRLSLIATTIAMPAFGARPAADEPRHPMTAPLRATAVEEESFQVLPLPAETLDAELEASAPRPTHALVYDFATGSVGERSLPSPTRVKRAEKSGDFVVPGNLGSVYEVDDDVTGGGAQEQDKVFGTDSRTRVNTTTSFPNRTVCRLLITFPGGGVFGGSGVMVGRRHVLTAASCVYSRSLNAFATSIQVIPGRNGNQSPFGSALATSTWVLPTYTTLGLQSDNIALITLNTTIGDSTGFRSIGAVNPINGRSARITGYPLDKATGTMWTARGTISSSVPTNAYYTIDTDAQNGQAGSGLVNSSGVVFGVHNGVATVLGFQSNYGTRIDLTKLLAIQAAINASQ